MSSQFIKNSKKSFTNTNGNSLNNNDENFMNIKKSDNSNKSKSSKLNNTFQNTNYLKCRKWEYVDEDKHLIMEGKFKEIEKKVSDNKNLLLVQIQDINLDKIFQEILEQKEEYSIGILNNLKYLIEKTYDLFHVEDDIKESDRIKLSPYLFKYREIKSDENSFFRGLIFYFLEYIILNNNKMMMIELLILFNEKISKNNYEFREKEYLRKSIEKVEKENILAILVIIIEHMDEENINIYSELSPYKILLKSFLKCPEFEYGMIFFTRYLIYKFISENEDKIYFKGLNLKIGNLLDSKYIINEDGEYKYLFEDFYKELMDMGECNQKINIFMTPYIFNCNLNILNYQRGGEENNIKESLYKCRKYTEIEINLLLKENFFHIYYKEYYYTKFFRQMDILLNEPKNEMKQLKIFNSENLNSKLPSLEKMFFSKNSKMSIKRKSEDIQENKNYIIDLPKCSKCKNFYKNKENIFGLCKSCLKEELKERIFLVYLEFLGNDKYSHNFEEELNNCLSRVKCCIALQNNIFLNIAIYNSGFKFKDLFYEIRKSMCLFCAKNIQNEYYLELPCGCIICSKTCFDKYMLIVKEKNKPMYIDEKQEEIIIKPLTECHCGFIYDIQAFLKLINKMEELKESDYKKIYEMQIKNNWKWLCMACRENFNNKNQYYRLFLKDNKIEEKIKKFELKHLICKTCADINQIGKFEKDNGEGKINCKFCNSEHKIESIKKVNLNNETESTCIII